MHFRLLVCGVFLVMAMPLSAKGYQSLSVIQEKIEQDLFTELSTQFKGNLKVTAEKVDQRLRLTPCSTDQLEVFNPYSTPLFNATTIGIRCNNTDNHWTLYVPVHISLEQAIVVAKHQLLKGQVISKHDVELANMDVSRLKQGYFTRKKQVIGQVPKQIINQGSFLQPNALEQETLIHRGQQVKIQVINESMKVSMIGIALTDGAANELIKVKNLSSNRIIEARVSSRSEVDVLI